MAHIRPAAHAVRAAHLDLTDAQFTAWFNLGPVTTDPIWTPPALRTPMTRVLHQLGCDIFADALVRIESVLAIGLDPDEAIASGDVGGFLALVQSKFDRAPRAPRRPGHVEVFDLTAYRAALGRPIEAGRFAAWLTPYPSSHGGKADRGTQAEPDTTPTAPPPPPPTPTPAHAPDPAPEPARADYIAAAAKGVLVMLALVLFGQWIDTRQPAPPPSAAEVALLDAVR